MAQTDIFIDGLAAVSEGEPPRNFHMHGDRGLARNWRLRAMDNVDAIKLSKEIEAANRPATPSEQEALMRYVGFGATEMATSLFPLPGQTYRRGWEEIGTALGAVVTDEELAAIRRGTQYAHYTPEVLVRAIWRAVRRLGFEGGSAIEPGCGTGLFFALMPASMTERSTLVGVEADPVTARIARIVHPTAAIREDDFTKVSLPAGFDLCIGNPPFSARSVKGADEVGRLGLSLHEFFIARSVRMLREGGIGAFVVSRYLMDKTASQARAYLSQMADLVGAIRLPAGAMQADAGTDAVVDLIFLRKRCAGEQPTRETWEDVDFEAVSHPENKGIINGYWSRHPDMVLGAHEITSSQYGPAYTVRAGIEPLDSVLNRAIERLPAGIYREADTAIGMALDQVPAGVKVGTAADGADLKEGSYFIGPDDRLMQVIEGAAVEVKVKNGVGTEGIFGKHAEIIRGLIPVRDAVRRVLRLQQANQPWEDAQADLRAAYKAFVKKHKAINHTNVTKRVDPETGAEKEYTRRVNLAPFMGDPDVWLVASIESYDDSTRRGQPGPIFSERVVRAPVAPKISGATDALAVVLNERGLVDMLRIAELLDCGEAEAAEALGDAVFEDPQTIRWVMADEYLSGRVKDKLFAAREAATANAARYGRNVLALEGVQPVDLKPSEISAMLGAPWIPASVIKDFIAEVIGIETQVYHTISVASWSLDMAAFRGKVEATSTWGTDRMNAAELLECALNQIVPKVHDTIMREDGTKTRVLNPVETEAAKAKLERISEAFAGWVWENTARAEQLCAIYNAEFNNLVPRTYSGEHLTFPGANPGIPVSRYQRAVVWQIIASGNTYTAHVVGSGKTRSKVLAFMEQRRLGLVSKPMLVVPSHTLMQWAREFLALYPFANILVADEDNFSKQKRAQWMARAATGNWDAIIISHDAFKRIPTPTEFERRMLKAEVDQIEDILVDVEEGDRFTRKRIEAMKEGFEAKLEALESRKDDLVTIAEIGVDQISVDEAQFFRKLSFHTNMDGVLGIDPNGSQRAWDLYVKAKYVSTINAGREILMDSGTPITNTMGELYTLMRFMCEGELRSRNIHYFDAWAAAFCRTKDELEMLPSGAFAVRRRFSQFVNIPELVDIFRSVANVLTRADLRDMIQLPRIKGGKRQVVTAKPSREFRSYQRLLGVRLDKIKTRHGRPQKGADIILTVINDGRHASIDMRFVDPRHEMERFKVTDGRLAGFDWDAAYQNDGDNKLNQMIDKVHEIWLQTSNDVFTQESGEPYPKRGGAQMIFSDLGTPSIEGKRFFSAYRWIRDRLLARGVPAEEIVFMQDYKKMAEKRRLFDAVDAGRVRILIGSSQTMGTGVNAQLRLKALHHLDVPWLPADVEQREGRIERQGNQYDEIEIYAWALTGSMDAPMWQTLERKQRFIDMVMKGDRSVRTMEDIGDSAVDQFAMAKAIASGDNRLMRQAGLTAEVARLRRRRSAHFDDRIAVRRHIEDATRLVAASTSRIEAYTKDLAAYLPTDDHFRIVVEGKQYIDWTETLEPEEGKEEGKRIEHIGRKEGGGALMKVLRTMELRGDEDDRIIAQFGGFDLRASCEPRGEGKAAAVTLTIETALPSTVGFNSGTRYDQLLHKIEDWLRGIQYRIFEAEESLKQGRARLESYSSYDPNVPFEFEDELNEKEAELAELERSLEASQNANDDEDVEVAA